MDENDVADIGIQTALPVDLPDFEGRKPVGVVTRVNGAGERISRAMHYEERVVLIVEGTIGNVGHGKTAQGMKRIQTISVEDLFEIEGRAGTRILNACRQSYRTADDARHGRRDLLGEHAKQAGWKMTPDGWTDATGRLLDDQELAEIRGTVIERAANDASRDPVALVFGDGSRAVWPEEHFDRFPDRPAAGEFVGDLQIVEVLDGATGETLEVWTDEDEDARLAELERLAVEDEARGNREAMEELEAGRGRTFNPDPFVGLPGGADGAPIAPSPDDDGPIADYETLSAREVVDRVLALTDRDEIFAVSEWEEAHGGRKTILDACGRRAAAILKDGQ